METPDLAALLDIERLDRDLFRGPVEPTDTPRHRLFGGLVCAQALVAAGRTVGADRAPHSLHGYFLRPGRADRPVLYKVDRDRDGRSFSARHVSAVQDGEVILSMLSSFHVTESSGELSLPRPGDDVPEPESLPSAGSDDLLRYLDVRDVRRPDGHGEGGWRPLRTYWARNRAPIPDDPLLHAAVIAYLSDLGSGFAYVEVEGLPSGGPTIDHAVWFHGRPRADGWLHVDQWPIKAGSARGLYSGAIHAADGSLVAVLTQEVLLRPGMRRPARPLGG